MQSWYALSIAESKKALADNAKIYPPNRLGGKETVRWLQHH